MPRSNDGFLTGAYSMPGGWSNSTDYIIGAGQNRTGEQSGAQVTIKDPMTVYDTTEYGRKREEENTPVGQTIPMFGARHVPPVVDLLLSTPEARPHAMSLLSHAVKDTERRYGERPLASNDLSRKSARLVNKGIKSGIIKGVQGRPAGELVEMDSDRFNSVNFNHATRQIQDIKDNYQTGDYDTGGYRGATKIDPNVMAADRAELVSQAMPTPTKKTTGPQFKQLGLFKE